MIFYQEAFTIMMVDLIFSSLSEHKIKLLVLNSRFSQYQLFI